MLDHTHQIIKQLTFLPACMCAAGVALHVREGGMRTAFLEVAAAPPIIDSIHNMQKWTSLIAIEVSAQDVSLTILNFGLLWEIWF